MSWLDLIDRAEALRAVFGRMVPQLDAVRLHEVTLHQDGPTIFFRFDLSEFPETPPPKWQKAAHNTVQVRLALDDVLETTVLGWTRNNVGRLSIEPYLPAGLKVEFVTSEVKVLVVSKFVRVDRIDAYRDSSRTSQS